MPFVKKPQVYSAKINELTLGTGDKAIVLGGQNVNNLYSFDGEIVYRQVASFRESKIGVGLIEYLIDCACATVDMYNDKFMMLNKGLIDIKKFIEIDG